MKSRRDRRQLDAGRKRWRDRSRGDVGRGNDGRRHRFGRRRADGLRRREREAAGRIELPRQLRDGRLEAPIGAGDRQQHVRGRELVVRHDHPELPVERVAAGGAELGQIVRLASQSGGVLARVGRSEARRIDAELRASEKMRSSSA